MVVFFVKEMFGWKCVHHFMLNRSNFHAELSWSRHRFKADESGAFTNAKLLDVEEKFK